MTMYLAAPALVAIVGCVLVSEKSDLWGLVVDSANAMAHRGVVCSACGSDMASLAPLVPSSWSAVAEMAIGDVADRLLSVCVLACKCLRGAGVGGLA